MCKQMFGFKISIDKTEEYLHNTSSTSETEFSLEEMYIRKSMRSNTKQYDMAMAVQQFGTEKEEWNSED